ncbi:hypothetical protein KFL_002390090 [Klebsormidium nitens]|uniref:Uncharacterized protein n=1 Tax=Klebsormidium nitens TaxID=105231 RepID=A0A1Y1I9X7_KLENI|nr:hypothetical protein KFL_002390090 [Klebsormidium nitens]|eukprot:GAQ85517.1 hypothetical protein KFL_002390090 [Klebsormidium nitens]
MASVLLFLCSALLLSQSAAASRAFGARRSLLDDEIKPAPASIGAAVPLAYFGPAPSSVMKELVGSVPAAHVRHDRPRRGYDDDAPVPWDGGGSKQLNGDGQQGGFLDLRSDRLVSRETNVGAFLKQSFSKQSCFDDFEQEWYVLTDTSDFQNAAALGLNPSAKLTYGNAPGAARQATLLNDGTLLFASGMVDFSPVHNIVPGDAPNYFPPKNVTAGSKGDENYSPLFVLTNGGGHVYNGPIIAGDVTAAQLSPFCGGIPTNMMAEAYAMMHDKIVSICPDGDGGNVTLKLTPGFSFGKPVLYHSLEGSAALPAALELATEAPALTNLVVGMDDGAFSAVERLFTTTNGYTNGDINVAQLNSTNGLEENHPLRQGLNSAVRGDSSGAGPLNILGGIPTVATDYSPLWDLNVGQWTDYAVKNYYRTQIRDEFTYLGNVQQGFITGPGGAPFGSSGFIVNCPIAYRFL